MTNKGRFYRLADITQQKRGLWYSSTGEFTGLIHTKFSFCTNSGLPMPFDPDLVGWLSVAQTLEELFMWFTREDIKRLEEYGYRIVVYEAADFRPYANHNVVNQETSVLVEVIMVDDVPILEPA